MKKPVDRAEQSYIDAINAHTTALRENTAALQNFGALAAAAGGPTGCCTISAPGVADRQVSKVTRTQCFILAHAIPGGVPHWVEGDCAM
jgi:hypothetical protein